MDAAGAGGRRARKPIRPKSLAEIATVAPAVFFIKPKPNSTDSAVKNGKTLDALNNRDAQSGENANPANGVAHVSCSSFESQFCETNISFGMDESPGTSGTTGTSGLDSHHRSVENTSSKRPYTFSELMNMATNNLTRKDHSDILKSDKKIVTGTRKPEKRKGSSFHEPDKKIVASTHKPEKKKVGSFHEPGKKIVTSTHGHETQTQHVNDFEDAASQNTVIEHKYNLRSPSSRKNPVMHNTDIMAKFMDWDWEIDWNDEEEVEIPKVIRTDATRHNLPAFVNKGLCLRMRAEATNMSPRMDKLIEGMKGTFTQRRKWIEEQPSVTAIIRGFPAFGFAGILDLEFKLLTKANLTKLRLKLQKQLDAHFTDGTMSKLETEFRLCRKWLEILNHTKLEKDTEEYEDLRNSVALMLLWHDVDKTIKLGDVFRFWNLDDDTNNEIGEVKTEPKWKRGLPSGVYAFIAKGKLIDENCEENRMAIFAEYTEIIRCNNFYDCMLLVYLIHNVFLMEYTPSVRKLFTYFDRLLQIHPCRKFIKYV